MEIAVVAGTGPAGQGIALRFAAAGHRVTIGSRRAESAEEVVAELLGTHAHRELDLHAAMNDLAAEAEVVVLATPWDAAAPTAMALAGQLENKLVFCMANALARVGKEFYALYPPRGSIAADVQAAIPGAHVVAAFQHLPAKTLAALDQPIDGDVLVCADHPDVLVQAMELIEQIPNLRALDSGSLANAAPVEAFTAVLLQLNRRYHSHTTIRVAGIDER